MKIEFNSFQRKPPKAGTISIWKSVLFSMMGILCIAMSLFIFVFNMRIPCELTGGEWVIFYCLPGLACDPSPDLFTYPDMAEAYGKCVRFNTYSDGGNFCTDSSECEGYCLTYAFRPKKGACQQNSQQIYWDGGNSCTSSDECKGDCVFIDITQPEKGGTCALNNQQNYQP